MRLSNTGGRDRIDIDVLLHVPTRHWMSVAIGIDCHLPITMVVII